MHYMHDIRNNNFFGGEFMINEKSEEFSNSQFALKAYMNFKDSNAYMHEAMVLFQQMENL